MTNLIEWLTRRGYDAKPFATAAEAAQYLVDALPEGISVGIGGSVTVRDMGLAASLRARGHNVFWHWEAGPEEAVRTRDAANSADAYICSANAITKDGLILNTDGTGNRVAATIYGPRDVYFIIGQNKICDDVESAYRRIKNVAAPLNAKRLNTKNPCAITGKCERCLSPQVMCGATVILERPTSGHKMHVLMVGEDLGF